MEKHWSDERIYAECERLGEDAVERILNAKEWTGGREIAAERWLRRKRRERTKDRVFYVSVVALIISAIVVGISWWTRS